MNNNNEYIKHQISTELYESLNNFLNREEYEDKYDGMFTGIIVDNNDPDKIGKCKIRVWGVHSDNIQDKDLPWAFPDFGFIGGLKGSFVIPPIDCLVNVYFERGDIYIPRYSNKVLNQNSFPTNKNTDYPDNMIFYETDNGDKYEINRKKKTTLLEHSSRTKLFIDDKEITITHNNGSLITINKQKIEAKHNNGSNLIIDNTKVEVKHNNGSTITMDVAGNIKIKATLAIELEHGLMTKSNGKTVIPTGSGPFCALPSCILGAPHAGNITM